MALRKTETSRCHICYNSCMKSTCRIELKVIGKGETLSVLIKLLWIDSSHIIFVKNNGEMSNICKCMCKVAIFGYFKFFFQTKLMSLYLEIHCTLRWQLTLAVPQHVVAQCVSTRILTTSCTSTTTIINNWNLLEKKENV